MYKITIWNKDKTQSKERDFRAPQGCGLMCLPRNLSHVDGKRPWYIEVEGKVCHEAWEKWVKYMLHPFAPKENITLVGEVVDD